ncbi:MAG: T9SS type A sorting domain-containing protein, partial [Bacteroidota bacterium]
VLNVTDYNGCTSTSSVNVLLYPAPAVPTITVTFDTLHSSAGLTYQWYKDGNIINGATSNSYIVPVNGNYTVVITDANGCTSVSVPYVFNSTGVNDIKNVSDKFMVFPNPATDELNITSKFGSSSSLNLDIIDIYGQVVYHYQLVNDNTTISLSTINSGIYLIRISNGETTVVKRFTKLSSN